MEYDTNDILEYSFIDGNNNTNNNNMDENNMNENIMNENNIDENNMNDNNIWKPDILVLGPGGAKAYLELGFLKKLEEIYLLDNLIAIVGCSVGSIIGCLYLADYRSEEILQMSLDLDIFNDIHSINIEDIRKDKGLISTNNIRNMLYTALKNRFGFIPTLKQFYQATGKTLTTVTVNLTEWKIEYLCHETHPDLSTIDSVIFSINIPLLFYKIIYKGCVYIDGAFGNPYPVNIYDNGKLKILGVHITSPYESDRVDPDQGVCSYLLKVLLYPISQLKKDIMDRCSDSVKHVELLADSVDVTGISFSIKDKAKYFYNGYKTGDVFYQQLLIELKNNVLEYSNDSVESTSINWKVESLDFNPINSMYNDLEDKIDIKDINI